MRIIPGGVRKSKTRGSGVILRTNGEGSSHIGSRFSGRQTLKHAKTTEAESGDWQRHPIHPGGANSSKKRIGTSRDRRHSD
jgi:hypothetical protein